MEFTLLGTYQLSRGFHLFGYDSRKNTLERVVIKRGEYLQLMLTKEGWIYFDPETRKVMVDNRLEYFEAMSLRSANNMISKMKSGKLKSLFNLSKPSNKTIDIFSPL